VKLQFKLGICFAILAAILLVVSILKEIDSSTDRPATFQAMTFRSASGAAMPYRFFIPSTYSPVKKYPLVVWLHGGEGAGHDNLKEITGGNWIGSHVWITAANQATYPSFVIAPQAAEDESWITHDLSKPTRQLRLVLELIENIEETYSIDRERLYVAGQSAGGFGTWAIIAERPDLFAAAVPICGGGDESKAAALVETPIWAFHGEKDETVAVERSRSMIAAIKKAGGAPRYTEYKGKGHAVWNEVFGEPDLLPWVFAQRRPSKL
jgi:predicted peptidase